MLIRRQIRLATALVVVLAVACLAVMELGRRAAAAQLLGRQDAQRITHNAVALLASTHHFLLFPSEDTARHWRERLSSMAVGVRHAREHWPGVALAPLASSLSGLEPLFVLLEKANLDPAPIAEPGSDLRARRIALIAERLVLETQSAAEVANRWSFDLDERMAREQLRWTLIAVLLQAALVLAIGVAAWQLRKLFEDRVDRLRRSAEALRLGQLEHRSGERRDDEIGVVARALDGAAAALNAQQQALVDANARLEDEVRDRRRSEDRLRLTFDALPARVGYWGADGVNRIANRHLVEHFGDGAPAQRRFADQADSGEPSLDSLASRVLDGEVVDVERVAGSRRLHTILRPEHGPSGQVIGFLSHEMDVTDHRLLEQRIAESERFLAEMTDRVPLQLGYVDADGVLRFANAAWCEAAGRERESIVGRPWSEALAPDVEAALSPLVQGALRGEPGRVEREEVPGRGGAIRTVEYQFVPGTVVDGGGFFWIGADVSARRQGEQLLARMAAIAPSGMLLVGNDGVIQFANAEAGRVFGYEVAELVGMPLLSLVPDEHREAHRGLQKRFFEHPVDRPVWVRSDLSGRRRDGSTVPVEIGLSAVDTATGTAVLALVLDVSERRAQQGRLEAALAGREMLLREFYHRVKNNLQMVHSLLRMQWRLLPSAPARRALEDTARRVQAMALVHEQLRQAHDSAQEVSLAQYTSELLRLAGEAAGAPARGIALRAFVDPVEVTLERALPYGLLVNELVSNALQHGFAPDLRGTIDVRLSLREDGPWLSVVDDGVGLPPGFHLDRLDSMGLQLATALARQLGGTLACDRARDAAERPGAVFTTGLPDLVRPLEAEPEKEADHA